MEIIKLQNIYYEYSEDIKVFDGLNFSLNNGQPVGIIGANGSGKTTLFSLIMGLSRPQNGDVILFGKRCTEEKDFARARRKIGYLFQDPDDQVFCPTVEEDIAFGPLNLGV
ncbi:MAG: ABC transporter ATP-binding protein, partial [Candidatus Omnitrophica bacterium]|nr:ABC transporter ATP-binding protein [Candidatus Omnitrophota bacterium]